MQSKGLEFAQRCTIFEVCNPGAAKAVLTAHMDLASALPCRIAVYTEGSSTVLSTLKPTLLLGAYTYSDVLSEAAEVETIMNAIMATAAGKK
jgi:uncharacterized protein (DUF302 family)